MGKENTPSTEKGKEVKKSTRVAGRQEAEHIISDVESVSSAGKSSKSQKTKSKSKTGAGSSGQTEETQTANVPMTTAPPAVPTTMTPPIMTWPTFLGQGAGPNIPFWMNPAFYGQQPYGPMFGGGWEDQSVEKFEDAFKFFDKNGDGTVNREELVISMRQFGGNPTDKEIDAIMLGLDKDDSDSIDFEEFVTIMVNYLKDPEEEERELMEAFQVFDRNGDGVVSTSEIKQVLKSIGKKMSTKEIEEIMKKADVNCDGELNYEEFVKLMTSNSFGS